MGQLDVNWVFLVGNGIGWVVVEKELRVDRVVSEYSY